MVLVVGRFRCSDLFHSTVMSGQMPDFYRGLRRLRVLGKLETAMCQQVDRVAGDCQATQRIVAGLDERLGEEIHRLGGKLEKMADEQHKMAVQLAGPASEESAGGCLANVHQPSGTLNPAPMVPAKECCYQPGATTQDGRRSREVSPSASAAAALLGSTKTHP
ncbi:unnamed protein product, partial [Polarella glacialis]